MNSADRMRAILFIWASFGFAAGFAFVGSATSINDIFLALIFATAAVLCTAMVMRSSADERTAQQVLDKAKRGRPDVYEMLDSLDDEELRILRQRLMSDSDAAMPLQTLLDRERRNSR